MKHQFYNILRFLLAALLSSTAATLFVSLCLVGLRIYVNPMQSVSQDSANNLFILFSLVMIIGGAIALSITFVFGAAMVFLTYMLPKLDRWPIWFAAGLAGGVPAVFAAIGAGLSADNLILAAAMFFAGLMAAALFRKIWQWGQSEKIS